MLDIKRDSYYQGDRPDIVDYVPDSATHILEIGCGEGAFAASLHDGTREIWGVEANRNAAQKAARRMYKVFEGLIEERMIDLPDDYFDLVVFNDVLEHLVDPQKVLNNVKEKLKADGAVIASIPNIRFSRVIYDLIYKKDFTYTEFGVLDSTHLRFFTLPTMLSLFDSVGISVTFFKGLNQSPSWRTRLFVLFMSIITFSDCRDMLYTQYLVVGKKYK
jgi:2-polyprenyl-3-methyl-5-hydroxy-6-metoxy-1,4-benzoquinol methylase